jgi:hypothetical protein
MLYSVDGVQGMTDDRLCYALGQLRDAISQTFDRRSRAVGMPYLTLCSLLVVPCHLLPLA